MKRIAFVSALALVLLLLYWQTKTLPDPSGDVAAQFRIVSLAPNLTGILFDLGAGGSVVGVTSYCDYPQEAASREKIGDFINPNFEKIVALRPNLVVAEHWSSSKVAPRLRQLGLRVVEVATPRSLEEIYQLVGKMGDLVDRRAQAQAMVEGMQRRAERIRLRASAFPYRPKVYLEIDLPSWTVGSANFTSQAIELCGGQNLFADLESPSSQVASEAVIARNPDVIVSFAAAAQQIRSRPGWNAIQAVRQGRIIDDFNESLLSQGNERLIEGMEQLQNRLAEVMGFD